MHIKFQTAKKAANSPPAFNKSNKFRCYFTGDVTCIHQWILIDMLKLPWCTQLLNSFFYKIKKKTWITQIFTWPMCCLSFDLQILINTLVSSNSSSVMYTAFDFNTKKNTKITQNIHLRDFVISKPEDPRSTRLCLLL